MEKYKKLSHLLETESNSEMESDSESESEIVSDFHSQLRSQESLNCAKRMIFTRGKKVFLDSSQWKLWAESINQVDVKETEKGGGDHENAYADPEISKKLIFECAHIAPCGIIFSIINLLKIMLNLAPVHQ